MMVHMGPEAAHPGVTPWGGNVPLTFRGQL